MSVDDFEARNAEIVSRMRDDEELLTTSKKWFNEAAKHEYSYHFKWLGRPIIQFPQDIVALQEIIWAVRPEVIVETGVARGGSLIFHASMLEILGGDRNVIGIDIDIRAHNRAAIEAHHLMKRIELIQGSSTSPDVVKEIHRRVNGRRAIVILDSLHTHQHVLDELKAYSSLVSKGSYLVVLDTIIEDMPAEFSSGRSWGPGNSPKTAVLEFLQISGRFEVDPEYDNKLLITVAPGGYLKCIKD
jgi:cephalosporin hydroxylase